MSTRSSRNTRADSPVALRRSTRVSSRSAARSDKGEKSSTSTSAVSSSSSASAASAAAAASSSSPSKSKVVNPAEIRGANGSPLGEDHAPGASKLASFIRRLWTSLLMFGGYCLAVHLGQPAMLLVVVLVQFMMYKEVVRLAYKHLLTQDDLPNIPLFRTQNWFWFIATMFFVYGRVSMSILNVEIPYHTFISFVLMVIAFVGFVLTLKKNYYRSQFAMFAWAFVTLVIIVLQSILLIYNMFEGLIWFVLPTILVVSNDSWAYVWGMLCGKTSLLELSPKKTWEGFLGSLVCTMITAFFATRVMTWYPILTCPQSILTFTHPSCDLNPIYIPVEYTLPFALPLIGKTFMAAPVQFHALAIGAFASIVAPFGGFFASGFKRAYLIKDFGDLIPGHGGLTDRMDCQLLMGTFVYVYYITFINTSSTLCACATIAAGNVDLSNVLALAKQLSAMDKEILVKALVQK